MHSKPLVKHYLFPDFLCFMYNYGSYEANRSAPEVTKRISCSTQLSMKFFPPINVKMPTVVGILIFMNRKNRILGLPDLKKAEFLDSFILISI